MFSENFEERVSRIATVLDKFLKAGMTINSAKCVFGAEKLNFLGFIVGSGEVSTDLEKIAAISEFPLPVVKKEMCAFIGLIYFYNKFVPKLSLICAPLLDTLKKSSPEKVAWSCELRRSFDQAKLALVSSVTLTIPRQTMQFVLQTDACNYGIAAVLLQLVEGTERPIAFSSQKLNKAEMNYAIIEK